MKKTLLNSVLLMLAMTVSIFVNSQPRLASEYCEENMGGITNGAPAGFTWETNASGDVVITLSEVDGGAPGTTNFRNTNQSGNGMCNDGLGKFKVGGADATNYFERNFTLGSQVYTLKLKDGVVAPAIGTTITFSGYVEYETSVNKDCWPDLSFSYTYGSRCAALAKPTNVAISSDKAISFDNIAGATSYKAFVYWKGDVVYEQVVTNGGLLNYHPSRTGIYNVYVQAYGAEDSFSPASNAVDWEMTAELAYLPQSEWCTTLYKTTANESEDVNVTWATDAVGNVIMTLSPVDGNTQTVATELRDLMSIDNLKIGDEKADASTYFNASYSGAVQTFALIDPAVKPAYGVTFYYDGLVAYRTGTHGNCWPTLHFTHVYGSTCNGYNDHVAPVVTDFSVVETDVHSVTFHVAATDADDSGTARAIASYEISSENHGFVTTAVTLDGSGNFTVDGLADNETYTFTIHAIDLIGNVGTADREVTLPFNTAFDLARGKECTASAVQNDNVPGRAVNGNPDNFWTCYGTGTGEAGIWWQVDLGTVYDIYQVKIHFNDIAAPYNIYSSADGTNWLKVVDAASASSQDTRTHSDLVLAARYFKVTSTNNHFGIKEFEVYGTGFSVADATNPTVSVTCPAKTINTATLQINASDLDDAGNPGTIAAINISGDNGFVTQNNVALNGSNQITLEGLNYNTTYTFTVTVQDRRRNETSANITVKLPLNTEYNLASGKTAVAGAVQDDYTANKGCDGNEGTMWSSYTGNDLSKDWWYVDLEGIYQIRQVSIKWMNDNAVRFLIQGAVTLPAAEDIADDNAWTTYLDYTYAEDPQQVKQDHAVVGKMRYLRIKSLQNADINGINFYELEVYGSDYAVLDEVAPVFSTNECSTETETATATLTLAATDDIDGAISTFYISCASPVVAETKYIVDENNQIAITGLNVGEDYTFRVRCHDLSGNWAETSVVAHFAMAAGTNVAEGKTATAGYEQEGYAASQAVDGREDTRFGNYGLDENPNWWKVDLANAYMLDNIVIKWEHYPTGGFAIEGSMNDADYSEIASYSESTAPERQVVLVTDEQANTPYRYIRIVPITAANFMSFYEFEVYASQEMRIISFANDAENNNAIIEAYDGDLALVTLNRTIAADGTWYTLCLPFDMDAEKVTEVFGESTIATLTGSEYRGTLLHLNFNFVNAIEAGKPYLIKVGTTFNAGTQIEGVRIKNAGPIEVGDDQMKFVGTYNQKLLKEANQRFVADNNYLYSPAASGNMMGAFRCYFYLPDGSSAGAPGRQAKIVFGPQTATGMENLQNDNVQSAKLLLNGVLYIFRDGKIYNAQGQVVK